MTVIFWQNECYLSNLSNGYFGYVIVTINHKNAWSKRPLNIRNPRHLLNSMNSGHFGHKLNGRFDRFKRPFWSWMMSKIMIFHLRISQCFLATKICKSTYENAWLTKWLVSNLFLWIHKKDRSRDLNFSLSDTFFTANLMIESKSRNSNFLESMGI